MKLTERSISRRKQRFSPPLIPPPDQAACIYTELAGRPIYAELAGRPIYAELAGRPISLIAGRRPVLYEHASVLFHAEPVLEPVAFAEKRIVNVQAAAVHGLKISLSLGKDHIRPFQQFFRFRPHILQGRSRHAAAVVRDPAARSSPTCAASSLVASFNASRPRTSAVTDRFGNRRESSSITRRSQTTSPQLSVT